VRIKFVQHQQISARFLGEYDICYKEVMFYNIKSITNFFLDNSPIS